MKHNEVLCPKCNGAGLLCNDDKSTWNVQLCPGCNGFGVVVMFNKKPVAFTVDANYEERVYGTQRG